MFIVLLLVSAMARAPDWHDRYLRWTAGFEAIESPEPGYRFTSGIHKAIAPFVQAHPGIITPEIIGRTVQKRPIWAFRIKDPMRKPKAKMLVFAGLHALEWIGTEVAVEVILKLAEHPIPDIEIIVVPLVNVDRRLAVEGDLLAQRKKYRRVNSKGVDLNRDFEINRDSTAIWRPLMPGYYTQSPAPLSQPESRAIDRLAEREGFEYAISLHSFGGYIYYPWAGLYSRTKDHKEYNEIGRMLEQAQRGRDPYSSMQLTHWLFLFRAQGSEIDHLYGKYGIKSFLIELTRTGQSLFEPKEWKNPFRWYNPKNPSLDLNRGMDIVLALGRHLGKKVRSLEKKDRTQ